MMIWSVGYHEAKLIGLSELCVSRLAFALPFPSNACSYWNALPITLSSPLNSF